jgi:hypothetical protein
MKALEKKLEFLINSWYNVTMNDVTKMNEDTVLIDFRFPTNGITDIEVTDLINQEQKLGNVKARFFSLKDKNRVMLTFLS